MLLFVGGAWGYQGVGEIHPGEVTGYVCDDFLVYATAVPGIGAGWFRYRYGHEIGCADDLDIFLAHNASIPCTTRRQLADDRLTFEDTFAARAGQQLR